MSGFENLCGLISPGDDLIKSSGEMEPWPPCHDRFPSKTKWLVDTYLLMPAPPFLHIEVQKFLGEKKVRRSLGPYNEVRGDKQGIRITEGCP